MSLVYEGADSSIKQLSRKPLDKKMKDLIKENLIKHKDLLEYLKDK